MNIPPEKGPRSPRKITRRGLLRGGAALAAAATIIPRHLLGGAGFTPPSEKLNIGVIGTGGRGKNLTRGLLRYDDVQVISICDVNEKEDYSRFYYRGISGRLPVLKLITDHYAKQDRGKYGGWAGDFKARPKEKPPVPRGGTAHPRRLQEGVESLGTLLIEK